jgi:hypothetical protein
MIERFLSLAEGVASRSGVSRRGFLGWLGKGALAAAGAVSGVLASASLAHAKKAKGGCLDNSDCGADEYCAKGEGDCDGLGQCVTRPQVCIEIYQPVCGCDDMTYSNSCFAAGNGVNVAYAGECVD